MNQSETTVSNCHQSHKAIKSNNRKVNRKQIIWGNKEQRANTVYWGLVGKPSDQRSRTKGLRARTGFLKPDRISNIVSESLSRMVPSLQ